RYCRPWAPYHRATPVSPNRAACSAPAHPREKPGFSRLECEIPRDTDCLLEGDLCGRPPRVKGAFGIGRSCRLQVCVRPVRAAMPLALMDCPPPRLPFGFRARCASPRTGFASVVGPTDGPSPPSPCLSERRLPLILDQAACCCGAR